MCSFTAAHESYQWKLLTWTLIFCSPKAETGLNSPIISLQWTSTATFTTADLTLVMVTRHTIISLCESIMCMYKSDCVVIIDATFVVAMQKRPMCYISNAIIWSCDLVKKGHCVSGSHWFSVIELCVEGSYFFYGVHLHWSWLRLDLANSRSTWVDFCFIYHTSYSLHLESLEDLYIRTSDFLM